MPITTKITISNSLKGRQLSEKHKKNISLGNKGKVRTLEQRLTYKECKKGLKCNWYINGTYCRTLDRYIRQTKEYIIWRNNIFKRDKYTCQKCNNAGCYLEAHHIRAFIIILYEFLNKYPMLDKEKDKDVLCLLATRFKPFWSISNGITLCINCHRKTRRKLRGD